jgi:dTDP-4-dehydrorhamnose 3,5-epimerase
MNIFDPSSYNSLRVTKTDIPGLFVIALAVHGDSRGWFKESFQKEKMVALGFPPDFEVVQNNISYNAQRGVTRGIHAEPWDKYVSIAVGSAFAAIVDLRKGDTFGKVLTFELNPGIALFVPKGCGNSYQSLEDGTTYSYLVNAHWSPDVKYTAVNLADPDLKIQWPLPLEIAEISAKDKINPMLKEIQPMEF